MKLRPYLTLLVVLIVSLTTTTMSRASTDDRPNIILFIVDDLGWQDTSVPMGPEPGALNLRYRTPHLEALAARGVRFSNAYAAGPVCTPSRTSIMTGQSPARTHITYWTLNKDTDTSRNRDDIAAPAWALNGLQPGDYRTLPERLAESGYRTIHAGKAHFGVHNSPGGDPTNLGFEVNIAGHASGAPASYYAEHHFTGAGRQGKPPHSAPNVWDVPGLDKYHGSDLYLTEVIAIEASAQIRKAADDDVPFYMNFAPYAVHTPIMANERYAHLYADLDQREAAYASMIHSVDAALGTLVTALDESGQIENTVIIFTSDNGGLSAHARGAAPDGNKQHTHNAPLRSGKGSAYEGGTRVPMIIAWPGVTDQADRANTINDTPVIGQDLYPTALRLARVEPDQVDRDGQNLLPLLESNNDAFDAQRTLGWNQPHQWGAAGPGIWPFTSNRIGDWKLIYFHAGRRFELYNLATDIGETDDLAHFMPTKVAEMAIAMDAWIDNTGAQLSIDKSTGLEIERPGFIAAQKFDQQPVTVKPVPSQETRTHAAGWGDRSWMDQFNDIRTAAREIQPRVVLIGDSITQSWGGPGRQVGGGGAAIRESMLDELGPVLNAGISGDRTQHILWRLDQGMLDGSAPETIVLMIGTNNLPHDSAADITLGIEHIMDRLSRLHSNPQVIVVSVPPRGQNPDQDTRVKGAAINQSIQASCLNRGLTFISLDPVLLHPSGEANEQRMGRDFVHFSREGYEAVATLLVEAITAEPSD